MSELTPEAKSLIRKYMLSLVAIPGILFSILSAIAGYVIHDVGQKDAYIESFRDFAKPVLEAAQAVSGAQVTVDSLSRKITEDAEHIEDLRKRIEASAAVATSENQVSQIVESLARLPEFNDRVARAAFERLGKFEVQLAALGSDRTGQVFRVNNPSMAGDNDAKCPPGTFVSALSASRGVGGKYASDGISEISVTCS